MVNNNTHNNEGAKKDKEYLNLFAVYFYCSAWILRYYHANMFSQGF